MLKKYRKARNLTQEQLASLAHMTSATISRLERKETGSRRGTVARLIEILEIPSSELDNGNSVGATTKAASGITLIAQHHSGKTVTLGTLKPSPALLALFEDEQGESPIRGAESIPAQEWPVGAPGKPAPSLPALPFAGGAQGQEQPKLPPGRGQSDSRRQRQKS
jgi:transcriptional regulator with XRE-family HTH domain